MDSLYTIYMKSKRQINQELLVINAMFPSTKSELNWETPFQLLVAVMLSAQSTDKQVNKVTDHLFQIIKNPNDILDIWLDNLKQKISSIWLYITKANNIYKTSWLLRKENNYIVPNQVESLLKLPWVGVKTAKVITHQLFWSSDIAVDTHVHRVSNRLAWVTTKTPIQTSKLLETLVYDTNKKLAHHSLVLFWRYHCKARKPLCESCPLKAKCIYYINEILKWKNN